MSLFFAYLAVCTALLSAFIALAANQQQIFAELNLKYLNRWPQIHNQINRYFCKNVYSEHHRYSLFILLGISGLCALLSGISVLSSGAVTSDILPLGLPWLHWHLRIDPLSGFFFCVLGIPLIAISFYGPAYVQEFEGGKHSFAALGLFTGLFVAGMELVLMADDAFFFMIAWEVMSVASYFLVVFHHEHAANRQAGFLYLLMAVIGAISIILAFGVLAEFGDGLTFDTFRSTSLKPTWASIAFILALIGFGMKAGLVPLHAWLPEAHPVAPSHISALMSGVMLKIAVYGFIRFNFDLLDQMFWQWGVVVLIIGSASALLGILYALQQQNLKRLLAYSSVENIGIIFMSLGLSIIFLGNGQNELGTLGLLAALLHCLNHALFKSLLFLGAGAIIHQTHEQSLENMGGLIHRMPKMSAIFLVGILSIAALPPLNGFVSEWLIFQTALQAVNLESGVLRSLIPTASAILALTSALAVTCFVKVYGIAFLGLPRTQHAAHAHEAEHQGMLIGPALLAGCCVLFGVLPTPLINGLGKLTQQLTGLELPNISTLGWLWLTPISAETATYAPSFVLVGILLVVGLCYYFLYRHTGLDAHNAEPWDCGFGGLNARMQYTAGAFSMPIRRIFQPVYEIHETHEELQEGPSHTKVTSLRYQFHIPDWALLKLYDPAGRAILTLARQAGRLQTGNIRTYLSYSFCTLIFLLWVIS
ncbi:hydrogenase 4 subunit B [Methylomonas sp. AM2-LC]|uniref:hydrogenase 4 subunit B n=1 Tax=Methylomonas sp. AM2-LC TaxID=3153301 RepID=UPI003263DCE6